MPRQMHPSIANPSDTTFRTLDPELDQNTILGAEAAILLRPCLYSSSAQAAFVAGPGAFGTLGVGRFRARAKLVFSRTHVWIIYVDASAAQLDGVDTFGWGGPTICR